MSFDPPPQRKYPVPTGIPTSVTLHELALLQHFAHEAGTVLEIGTHYGFSCIGMALAGAHVTSVDPHFEGPANAPDTWEPFLANVARHGVPAWTFDGRDVTEVPLDWGGIDAYRVPIESMPFLSVRGAGGSLFAERIYGLVFIDGNHTWPCPWRDTEIAMAHLTAPGYIAYHDVTSNWPGVYRAALQLEAKGWREVGRVQTLRVYQRP